MTTEDIDEELVSQEPLLLVPEELSMSTSLAKEQLAPLLAAANLPSLEVYCYSLHVMCGQCCMLDCHSVLLVSQLCLGDI